MTSLDDGSTGREPHADHDPVRSRPPADPWLTEAPTSVVGDAASLAAAAAAGAPGDTRPFGAPMADTKLFGAAAPSADAAPPMADVPLFGAAAPAHVHPRALEDEPRRGRRWVAAVLAACLLFIGGWLAVDQFGDDDGAQGLSPSTGPTSAPIPTSGKSGSGQSDSGPGESSRTKSSPTGPAPSASGRTESGPPATGAAVPAGAGVPQIVYEVKASGSRNTGSVTYTDQDGESIRLNGISLPWRKTFPLDGRRTPLILDTQRKGGGDGGPVTCTITVDGKLLASTTAEGEYAAAMCTGSG